MVDMMAELPATITPLGMSIISVDHPAYGSDVDRFLDDLRGEPRFFGPTAKSNPKPFPSLIEALRGRGGFRIAAIDGGRIDGGRIDGRRIVGMARVDGAGELFIAVVADRRGGGIGSALGRAALERAAALHYRRLVMRSSRRSRAARGVAEQLGCRVVDHVHGRTELILTPVRQTLLPRSA